jgi:hypothetical protein
MKTRPWLRVFLKNRRGVAFDAVHGGQQLRLFKVPPYPP